MLKQTNAKNLEKATTKKCLEDKQNIFNSFPGLRQLDLQELDHVVPRLVRVLFLNNVIIFGHIQWILSTPLPPHLVIMSFLDTATPYHHCHPHPPHHHHHPLFQG